MIFNADNSYISVSRITGEKLAEMGFSREEASFDDLRRVIISGIGDAEVREEDKELHFLASVVMSGVSLVFHCIARSGCPAGNKQYTIVVFNVMTKEKYDKVKRFDSGISEFTRLVRGGEVKFNSSDLMALKNRLRKIEDDMGEDIHEKIALRKIIDTIQPLVN